MRFTKIFHLIKSTSQIRNFKLLFYTFHLYSFIDSLDIESGNYILSHFNAGLTSVHEKDFFTHFSEIVSRSIVATAEIESLYSAMMFFIKGIEVSMKALNSWPNADYLRLAIGEIEIGGANGFKTLEPNGFLIQKIYIFLSGNNGVGSIVYPLSDNRTYDSVLSNESEIEKKCMNMKEIKLESMTLLTLIIECLFIIINMSLLLFLTLFVIRYRHHKIFSLYGISFYYLLNSGLLILIILPILFIFPLQSMLLCYTRKFYLPIAFAYFFTVISMRTTNFFYRTRLSKVKSIVISNSYLIIYIPLVFLVSLLLTYIIFREFDMK